MVQGVDGTFGCAEMDHIYWGRHKNCDFMKRADERSGLKLKYSKIVIFLNNHDIIGSMAMENISMEKVSAQ